MNFSNRALPLSVLTLVAAMALPACGSSSSSSSSGAGGGATTSSNPLEPLTACVDDDIMDSFSGPGWDPSKGGLQPPVQSSYTASTTIVLQTDPAKVPKFSQLITPIMGDLPTMPGLIGYQFGISQKCHYARTLTVWKDTASMMNFVMSPNHVTAMGQVQEVSDAAAVTNWDIAAADMPPTWAMARQQIAASGRDVY